MKRHIDVLQFQVVNWVSGIVWFSAFLHLASPQHFAQIAKAELMFGFFGVFITNLSLRLHGECRSRSLELRLLVLRLSALTLVAGALALGVGSMAGVLAMAGIALTPAHLPLLLGHQTWLLALLLVRLPLALAAFVGGMQFMAELPAEAVAAVYFGPGLLYGLLAYRHYYRLLPNTGSAASLQAILNTQRIGLLSQLLATAAANQIQAQIVAGLVLAQPGWALIERLLRSAHSFAFPHLWRGGLISARVRIVLGVFSVVAILGIGVFGLPTASLLYVLLPTLLDAYSAIAAGSLLRIDVLFIAAAGLFHFRS